MELRPYQNAAISAINTKWGEFRRLLAVLPTGTGKTIVFANLTAQKAASGKRSLILAHREELLEQARDKLYRSTGLIANLEKAESTIIGNLFADGNLVTVGSVQTMMRQKRLDGFGRDYFDYIIVDEAHHALSDSYRAVLDYFDKARVLGVTATPDRGDKRNLGEYFEDIAYEYPLHQAISDGYLSRISAETIPLHIDLSGCKKVAGDYSADDLGNALSPYLDSIASEMAKRVSSRKVLVFLPLVATSKTMTELLNSYGFRACHIDGNSPERKEILSDFHANRYNALCNSMLLTEGFDEPDVDCIVCLRPTKVRALYAQIVGRGTRISPGKQDCLVLDFLWHTAQHDLIHPAHLIAKTEEIAEAMTIKIEAAQSCLDLEEVEREVNEDARRQREEALAKQLAEQRKKKGRTLNPLAFALSINAEDLCDYEPLMSWEMKPPSEKQVTVLQNYGFPAEAIPNKGFASKLMDRIFQRMDLHLATPKQVSLLSKYGYNAGEMTMIDAKSLIDKIAANGWRRPVEETVQYEF